MLALEVEWPRWPHRLGGRDVRQVSTRSRVKSTAGDFRLVVLLFDNDLGPHQADPFLSVPQPCGNEPEQSPV